MTRLVSRAESFDIVYKAFEHVNFSAFDFYTVKESLIEYVKLNFPENFNDFIESSEFIATLEIFSYIAETHAYRLDITASENFITHAERKSSVLRLAKFLSYKATRNLPARGLVKLDSIKTTEDVYDINGTNLANKTIRWNDPNNPNWKSQFLLVINKILKQKFGSVLPSERVQVDDVLFELYDLENNPTVNGVLPLTAKANGKTYPMELVPVSLNEYGPKEKRPENNSTFSILYGSDGLGDGSDTTGFFMFIKQGVLQSQTVNFDGITPNQTYSLNIDNINDTDIWLNKIDSDTLEIIDDNSIPGIRSGEWVEVDLAHAQNIIYNTNPNRNKYEVESLENDQVKLIFGDGEFANIPSGLFNIWLRTSANETFTIPKTAISNKQGNFTYKSNNNSVETITFNYSLINSLQNGSETEDIEHIRKLASAVYYTQDRMVNGRDYNTFMLQDITILKLKSINRTFAGDSKYIGWRDPKEHYEDVKLFGDDLALFYKLGESSIEIINEPSSSKVLENYIEPLLNSSDFFLLFTSNNISPSNIRTSFTQQEKDTFTQAMDNGSLNAPETIHLFYSVELDEWVFNISNTNNFINDLPFSNPAYDENKVLYDWDKNSLTGDAMIKIVVNGLFNWKIIYKTERIISQSDNIKFWNSNDANRVISFDTLNSNDDEIVVLSANEDVNREKLLGNNQHFNVIGQELVEPNIPITGLRNVNQLSIIPSDNNNDSVPDNLALDNIINPKFTVTHFSAYQEVNYNDNLKLSNNVGNGAPTAGYQIVNYNSTLNGSNQVGQGPSTQGYQIVNYGGTLTNGTTISSNAGLYTFSINIDSSGPQTINLNLNGNESVATIISNMNTLLTGVTVSLDNGNLKFLSDSYGVLSSIFLNNGAGSTDIFSTIPNYVTIDNSVQGTNPPGLETATYDFNLSVDGSASNNIQVNVLFNDTFNDLINKINAAITGATVSIVNGDLKFISNTTGNNSAILLSNGTTKDLLSSIENYLNILAAIPGITPLGLAPGTYNYSVQTETNNNNFSVTIIGNESFSDLLNLMNNPANTFTVSIIGGNLRFVSKLKGATSSIQVTDGTTSPLFSNIENYNTIDAMVNGSNISVSGRNSDTIDIPFNALYGDIELEFEVGNDATYSYYLDFNKIVTFSPSAPSAPGSDIFYWFDTPNDNLMEWNGTNWIVSTAGPTLIKGSQVNKIIIYDTGSNRGTQATTLESEKFGIKFTIKEYVYFQKEVIDLVTNEYVWKAVNNSSNVVSDYYTDLITKSASQTNEWKRDRGRFPLNFLWMHRAKRLNLIDPAASNIIDTFIITRGYYNDVVRWIDDKTDIVPVEPTPLQLRSDYNSLLDNKMISDTLILHAGKIKILFGNKAIPELQAKFKIVRSKNNELSNNQIKVKVIGIIKDFFDINSWEFGESFYFTELASKIHVELISDVATVVLVPNQLENLFGDLFIVQAKEDEILQPHITVNDIEIVESLNPDIIKQGKYVG